MSVKKIKYLPPVSIVMIAYNEESTIQRVLEEYSRDVFQKLPKGSEFLLYLDKPSDGTVERATAVARNLKINVVVGTKNLGYAEAMKKILQKATNEVIFYSDSSGKHQAKDFWKLLPYAQHYDIVSGIRTNRSDPFIRQVITFLQRVLVSLIFQVPFHDYNTGFKIVHKAVLRSVLRDCKYTKQSFSTELLLRALKKGHTITGASVLFRARKNGNEGTNFKQLPSIIFFNLKGIFYLFKELRSTT